jgi:hypothetical protein
MTCSHLWLPQRGALWRYVVCPNCDERRRVRRRWAHPEPRSIHDALSEAIDHDVIANNEVTWGGRRLR